MRAAGIDRADPAAVARRATAKALGDAATVDTGRERSVADLLGIFPAWARGKN